MKQLYIFFNILSVLLMAACTDEDFYTPSADGNSDNRIAIAGEIMQEYTSRANDEGFCDGDQMGVYIVDYAGDTPGTLLSAGNRGDNVRHTFDEQAYRWISDYDLFWKDKTTRIDVYAYYPYDAPDNVNDFRFTVRDDQSTESGDNGMGGYEASDFLWGKVPGVEPTSNVIKLPMRHKMANARVTLVEGDGFDEGEWADTRKQVLVLNTCRQASIDLSTGTVTPQGSADNTSIIPARTGDEWRAIVVPQSIAAGTRLFSITIGGIPYTFAKDTDFTYTPGKMSNFTIRVDKKANTGDYSLTLISESITAWENDLVSHDAEARQYVVINSTAGGLKEAIIAANKDFTTLKNLKITGEINATDFFFMRDEMSALSALNLKEVIIREYHSGSTLYIEHGIPSNALWNKKSLSRIILPDRLISIGSAAFSGCDNLMGSLIIPEGVIDIGTSAFSHCKLLTGTLSLPSTLRYIGSARDYNGNIIVDGSGSSFAYCGFTCELVIPDNVEYIGLYSFYQCSSLYGSIRLPNKLKKLGTKAFYSCSNLTGSLVIPQGVTEIESYTFFSCGFDGTLTLHDGIESIGESAFENCHFKGELILPKNLTIINGRTFGGCNFSGELKLPKGIVSIGEAALANNSRLRGILEFGSHVESIGKAAFSGCSSLEGLVFPESLENIGDNAFYDCYGIGSIVCGSDYPAHVSSSSFDGVPKDNFTLEVPEAAVATYSTTPIWNEFKRIAAHHELVCRPAVACALSSERKQTLVIDAEGPWEVASKPDWCEVSPSSGNKKTEVTLTISATDRNAAMREGEVVFRLTDKDYTHSCKVTQYGYEYAEDEYLTLQSATKGNRGGINIVILGDGYNAADIAGGTYLADMRQQIEYFFGIEPYTTYREYFNVYTAFPLSTESGVGSINTIRYNRFGTTYTGGVGLKCDYDAVFDYALAAPTVTADNLNQTLIIIVPNSTDYGGITQMWSTGAAIAFCPKSDDDYPYDSRGLIQHEAGGHGFGKLGDEYIYANAFIDACGCGNRHVGDFQQAKAKGWYDNMELTGKMHEVGWSHLIFDDRYSDIVDIYEGGFYHTRGVFRSEQNSCMNNNIPYYSTISRESIVKRIMRYAGMPYSFEAFVANDNRNAAAVQSRAGTAGRGGTGGQHHSPVIHTGNPLKNLKRTRR